MCYTYDELSRVTRRTITDLNGVILSEETFTYDSAGNITDAPDCCFAYDANNRLTTFCNKSVTYDLDGNMLSAIRETNKEIEQKNSLSLLRLKIIKSLK